MPPGFSDNSYGSEYEYRPREELVIVQPATNKKRETIRNLHLIPALLVAIGPVFAQWVLDKNFHNHRFLTRSELVMLSLTSQWRLLGGLLEGFFCIIYQ